MADLSGKEKAAIFLLTLGCESSTQILGYLPQQDVEIISYQIASMGNVNRHKMEQVLCEFRELNAARSYVATGGIDYAKNLLSKAFGTAKADEIIQKISVFLHRKPFEFVKRVKPERLASFLKYEQPQTIALVLAYLEPEAASRILSSLPRSIQGSVARRIAVMDRTSPEMLHNVEKVLEKKLALFDMSGYREAGGLKSVMEILKHLDKHTEASILSTIKNESPELSEKLNAEVITFDDITKLADTDLRKILFDLSDDDISKALRTASYEVSEKILRNISPERVSAIRNGKSVPVRLDAIESAQWHILSAVRKYQECV